MVQQLIRPHERPCTKSLLLYGHRKVNVSPLKHTVHEASWLGLAAMRNHPTMWDMVRFSKLGAHPSKRPNV
jgi:hypothetical protein